MAAELPWVRIDKEYRFETDEGMASLADLFRGRSRSSSIISCSAPSTVARPACSANADGFNGFAVHLEHHDVAMIASHAPHRRAPGLQRRMGWTFTWASSLNSDFNYDFNTSFTEEQQRSGSIDYNYSTFGTIADSAGVGDIAAMTGTDVPTYTREAPGMSAFALSDGVVSITHTPHTRGLDVLWGIYQWLDRAPNGRNESNSCFRSPPHRIFPFLFYKLIIERQNLKLPHY